ncbi:MAG: Ppx/GppA phosphatase family protein [Solirubrobacteraceae bacterium]
MRVAVIDIGTNSTRLLLAEVQDGRIRAEIERRSTVTRLGAGVDAEGRLREDAMARVFATLETYSALIERHGAGRRVAVLTSAVRDAANGREFADIVGSRFALEPHVLSGESEAQLTFLGATSDRDPAETRSTLVVDIGGGSTELVIGNSGQVEFHVSTQAGVVRQSERHIRSDPPSREELEEMAGDLRAIIAAAVPEDRRRSVVHAIGVAGTSTSVAAIAQGLEVYDPERIHGYVVGLDEVWRIGRTLAAMPLARRREVPGLHPDRAPTIVPGVVILIEVMGLFGLRAIEISEHDILRGAALGLGEPGL